MESGTANKGEFLEIDLDDENTSHSDEILEMVRMDLQEEEEGEDDPPGVEISIPSPIKTQLPTSKKRVSQGFFVTEDEHRAQPKGAPSLGRSRNNSATRLKNPPKFLIRFHIHKPSKSRRAIFNKHRLAPAPLKPPMRRSYNLNIQTNSHFTKPEKAERQFYLPSRISRGLSKHPQLKKLAPSTRCMADVVLEDKQQQQQQLQQQQAVVSAAATGWHHHGQPMVSKSTNSIRFGSALGREYRETSNPDFGRLEVPEHSRKDFGRLEVPEHSRKQQLKSRSEPTIFVDMRKFGDKLTKSLSQEDYKGKEWHNLREKERRIAQRKLYVDLRKLLPEFEEQYTNANISKQQTLISAKKFVLELQEYLSILTTDLLVELQRNRDLKTRLGDACTDLNDVSEEIFF